MRRALAAVGLIGAAAAVGARGIGLRRARAKARARLAARAVRRLTLSDGDVAYIDCVPECAGHPAAGGPGPGPHLRTGTGTGTGPETILSVHGLYGGYDQALDNVGGLTTRCRIVAPSRFGYPGSDVQGDGSPAAQATVLAALLDHLGIEKVFVLGASAGGTPAIRFALDHPERVTGLILLSSAAPWPTRPEALPGRMGPPPLLNHDWVMWMLSPLFGPVFGMAPGTVTSMLPLALRRTGADIDASVTNRDMAVHFEDYPVEQLQVPVLLLHALDDRVAVFAPPAGNVQSSMHRYPDLTAALFRTGGHLISGHGHEVEDEILRFINAHAEGAVPPAPAHPFPPPPDERPQ